MSVETLADIEQDTETVMGDQTAGTAWPRTATLTKISIREIREDLERQGEGGESTGAKRRSTESTGTEEGRGTSTTRGGSSCERPEASPQVEL